MRAHASAAPIRSTVFGWVPNTSWSQSGGFGSPRFWSGQLALDRDERGGVAVEVERVAVGRALHLARERVAGDVQDERDDRDRQRGGGQDDRAGGAAGAGLRGEPLGEPLDHEHPGGRDDREPEQAARHVAVLHVAELVRHHRAHLVGREVLQQRVVEHHALGVADAVHVGVGAGGAAARVDPVDLPHVDAVLVRKRQDLAAEGRVRQRRELVEERIDDDRPVRHEHGAEHDDGDRAERPPRAREAADQRHQESAAECREHGADAGRLRGVPEPAAPVLGREPEVAGALLGDRAQRQLDDHQGEGEGASCGCRGEDRPPCSALEGASQAPGRAHGDQRERAGAERRGRRVRAAAAGRGSRGYGRAGRR